MKVFLSAPASEVPRITTWLQGALGSMPAPRPGNVSIIRHDPQLGSRVQDALRTQIAEADVIIADLAGRSPNVLLEVGFALGLKKPLVFLAEDSSEAPADVRHAEIILAPKGTPESYMAARLAGAMQRVLEMSGGGGERKKSSRAVRDRGKLFISYSHKDRAFLDRILVHLRPLERAGLIELWVDEQLRPGDRWREEIKEAIDGAGVALLLISADFLASEFIATDELPPLLAAAEERGTQIIPVIIKPSRFLRDKRLSRFHAVNDPNYPVIRMSEADREELFASIAETIEIGLGVEDIE